MEDDTEPKEADMSKKLLIVVDMQTDFIDGALGSKEAEKIVSTLKGNTCGFKPTSCADQLAKAIEKALLEEKA